MDIRELTKLAAGPNSQKKRKLEADSSPDPLAAPDSVVLTHASLKRMLQTLDDCIASNQDQRQRYASNPAKFLESEAELHERLNEITTQLSAQPKYMQILLQIGSMPSIMSLLTHPNSDIVLDVLTFLKECTDEDVLPEEGDGQAQDQVAREFVEAMLECQLLDLLADLALSDASKEDLDQIEYAMFGMIENGLTLLPARMAALLLAHEKMLGKLLMKAQSQKKEFDTGNQYASELLAIALQSVSVSPAENGDAHDHLYDVLLNKLDGMSVLLSVLSQFRKRDPRNADEQEFMENLFDCICCLLTTAPNLSKPIFIKEEGMELMILMLKNELLSRLRALKVIAYALTGLSNKEHNRQCCQKLVDAGGLKHVMSALMKKQSRKLKKAYPKSFSDSEEDEHALTIVTSLLRNLDDEAPTFRLSRLMVQFVEDDGGIQDKSEAMSSEKIRRLIDLHVQYRTSVAECDAEIEQEKRAMDRDEAEEMEPEWYLNRLERGLFTLQLVDLILLDVLFGKGREFPLGKASEQKRLETAQVLVAQKNIDFGEIAGVVQEYADNLGDGSKDPATRVAVLSERYRIQIMIENYTKARNAK